MTAYTELHPTPQNGLIANLSHPLSNAAKKRVLTIRVTDDETAEPIELPAETVDILTNVLEALEKGQGITVFPANGYLTTFQAAEIMGYAHRYFHQLLDKGEIPFHLQNQERVVRMKDLMAYKQAKKVKREKILEELTVEAQLNGDYAL